MATSLKLSEELKSKVQHLATLKNRTAHGVMCEAICNYIEKETVQENFKQEALKAWENYQETGLHLISKEVQDWLSSWGNR